MKKNKFEYCSIPLTLISIIDVCSFGRIGLLHAFSNIDYPHSEISVYTYGNIESALGFLTEKINSNTHRSFFKNYMVLRLPSSPILALQLMLQLNNGLMTHIGYRRLVVISPFKETIIRQVLTCCNMQLPICIVDSRDKIINLCFLVLNPEGFGHCFYERLPQIQSGVLSEREKCSLRRTLAEVSIQQQARQQNCSPKTIYTQRQNALKKLKVNNISSLMRLFIPNKKP